MGTRETELLQEWKERATSRYLEAVVKFRLEGALDLGIAHCLGTKSNFPTLHHSSPYTTNSLTNAKKNGGWHS